MQPFGLASSASNHEAAHGSSARALQHESCTACLSSQWQALFLAERAQSRNNNLYLCLSTFVSTAPIPCDSHFPSKNGVSVCRTAWQRFLQQCFLFSCSHSLTPQPCSLSPMLADLFTSDSDGGFHAGTNPLLLPVGAGSPV